MQLRWYNSCGSFFDPICFLLMKKNIGNFFSNPYSVTSIIEKPYKICKYFQQNEYKAKFSKRIHLGVLLWMLSCPVCKHPLHNCRKQCSGFVSFWTSRIRIRIVSYKYVTGCGSGSGSFPFLIKVWSGMK